MKLYAEVSKTALIDHITAFAMFHIVFISEFVAVVVVVFFFHCFFFVELNVFLWLYCICC